MKENNPENNPSRIERRKMLKYTVASVIASSTIGSNPVAASDEQEEISSEIGKNQPDIRIVDNKSSKSPVSVEFNVKSHPSIDSENSSGRNDETTFLKTFNTIGLHATRNNGNGRESGQKFEDAVATLENIIIEQSKELFPDFGRRVFDVVVSKDGFSDSTTMTLGPNGASSDDTLSIQLSSDGTVSADTYITCH